MKLTKRRIAVVVGLGFLAAGIWLAWPRERSLLEIATKVADTGDPAHGGWCWYAWLNDHEVLFARNQHVLYMMGAMQKQCWQFYRHELRTNRDTPLTALNLTVRDSAAPAVPGCPAFPGALSPSGRWLLWPEQASRRGPPAYRFATLDGHRALLWRPRLPADDRPTDAVVLWSAGNDEAFLFVMDRQSSWRALARFRPSEPDRSCVWSVRSKHCAGEPSAMAPGPAAVLCKLGNDGVLSLSRQELRGPANEPQTRAIRIPGQYSCVPVAFSSDGAHIVFETASIDPLPPTWLARALVHSNLWRWRVGAVTQALYVGTLDGTRLTEVGHRTGTVPGDADEPRVKAVAWMPDEKRISFTYNHALWTVPAG